jgi:hypothetical protein
VGRRLHGYILVNDGKPEGRGREAVAGISAQFHISTLRHLILLILQRPKICFTEEILI